MGKQIRMKRLMREGSHSCFICALDHGMTSPKFLDGLKDTQDITCQAIAGGAVISADELLHRFQAARSVGAIGCSVGRNIFQHDNPEAIARAISRIFHDKWQAKEAIDELDERLKQK